VLWNAPACFQDRSPSVFSPFPSTPFCPSSYGSIKTMKQWAPATFGVELVKDEKKWTCYHTSILHLLHWLHTRPPTGIPGLIHLPKKTNQ
jgi:hypothetical protein